jgi:hypothetical protein
MPQPCRWHPLPFSHRNCAEVGDVWDWVNVYFHDLQYEANHNTKMAVYSRLWSLPIGGPGKYTPTLMRQVPATWDFNSFFLK